MPRRRGLRVSHATREKLTAVWVASGFRSSSRRRRGRGWRPAPKAKRRGSRWGRWKAHCCSTLRETRNAMKTLATPPTTSQNLKNYSSLFVAVLRNKFIIVCLPVFGFEHVFPSVVPQFLRRGNQQRSVPVSAQRTLRECSNFKLALFVSFVKGGAFDVRDVVYTYL